MVLFLWGCAPSWAYSSVDWYDDEFQDAAELWLPGWDWVWLKAQCQQESLLKADAVSPAGAMGLCQFMPGTWREEMQRRGIGNASPFNPYLSIQAAGSYMARLCKSWKSERPENDRRRLAQASYNAGIGNILKAQKRCNNARHWPEISACLIQVTGPRNSHETLTYVKRIEYWYLFFIASA